MRDEYAIIRRIGRGRAVQSPGASDSQTSCLVETPLAKWAHRQKYVEDTGCDRVANMFLDLVRRDRQRRADAVNAANVRFLRWLHRKSKEGSNAS